MLEQFDARNFEPRQGMPKHDLGKFPAVIIKASIEPNKDNTGGMLRIRFKTPVGEIEKNYNLFNQNTTAVKIAQQELSALCYAVGRFQPGSTGENLLNAQCQIEVAEQTGNKDFVEVRKVYDVNGNEPGKSGSGAPQPQPQQQPQFQQQPQPGPGPQFQPQPQPQPNPPPQQQGGWGPGPAPGPAPQPQPGNWAPSPAQQQQQPAPQAPAWSQQSGGAAQPAPWGNR